MNFKILQEELYEYYYPIFIPFGFDKFLDLDFVKEKSYIVGVSVEEYFYRVIDSDFYLLDKVYLKFLKLSISQVVKVLIRGKMSGKIYILSYKEIQDIEDKFGDIYGKAFIYCKIFNNAQLAVLVYFIAKVDKILNLFKINE